MVKSQSREKAKTIEVMLDLKLVRKFFLSDQDEDRESIPEISDNLTVKNFFEALTKIDRNKYKGDEKILE